MSERICKIKDCGRLHEARGLCVAHYQRWRKYGDSDKMYSPVSIRHGECIDHQQSVEHVVWQHMIQRCVNPHCSEYINYGGRGITVCNEWRHNFPAFLKSVGRKPGTKYSIERINNNGNYEPGNVKWATRTEQDRNKRTTRRISIDGKTLCLIDWAKKLGVSYQCLQKRSKKGIPLNAKSVQKRDSRGRIYWAWAEIIAREAKGG